MRKVQLVTHEVRSQGQPTVTFRIPFPPDYFRPPLKAGWNTHHASASIRRVANRNGSAHWNITIRGRYEDDVRDTIQSLRSAAPFSEEINTLHQRKWLSFPNDRASKFAVETNTFVLTERDGANPSSMDKIITIFGTEFNVKQACKKLAQYTATCLTTHEVPKNVARWIVGHNWSRAEPMERAFDVRFVKEPCESNAALSVVKIIGSKEAANKAYSVLSLPNVKRIEYNAPVEFGIYLTNHKGFRQRRIETDTDTVIIFEKKADIPPGLTCCMVVGHAAKALVAVDKLKELRRLTFGVRVQLSFHLGRYVVGDPKGNHPRRQMIEELFNVTMHLERENQGRNFPSVMIVAGHQANVHDALVHLLREGPLVEMVYEVNGAFYGHLVTRTSAGDNNFDKVNGIGSSTQTQINVSNAVSKKKCKCGDQEQWVFEVSVAGPYKRVIEALRGIEELLLKPGGGLQPVQNALRFRKGVIANIRSEDHSDFGVSSMPLATNGAGLLAPFVYPLTYWPEGTEIAMSDFVSRVYLEQCQRFGARFCRNCPVHYRELGGEDGYDQKSDTGAGASFEADFAKLSSC